MTESGTAAVIERVKRGDEPLQLPIRLGSGETVGSLQPVTWSDASDPVALERLTRWRNANMASFLTQFAATPSRTAGWLRDSVLSNDRQMLFWVRSEENVVGHIGFKDLTETDALSDNVIRGERGGHPKLFAFAHLALFKWLYDVFGITSVYGWVFSDNVPAIMMNRQVGFSSWQRHALRHVNQTDGEAWVVGEALEENPGERFCWRVSIAMEEVFESLECRWTK